MIQPETWRGTMLVKRLIQVWFSGRKFVYVVSFKWPLTSKIIMDTKPTWSRTVLEHPSWTRASWQNRLTEGQHRHTEGQQRWGTGGVPIITQLNTECYENALLSPTTTPPMPLFYWTILCFVSQTPGQELVLPHCTYVLSQAISVFPRSVSTLF